MPRGAARRGVTLVELVVAMAVTSIVLGASVSVMFVATRAIPTATDAAVTATDAAAALTLLESEVQCAIATRAQATSLVVRIPDRDNDGQPEQITFAWAGTPGAPLTRTHAGQTITLVPNVHNAHFEWTTAPGSATRLGAVYLTMTLDRGLVVRSTVRLIARPENNL